VAEFPTDRAGYLTVLRASMQAGLNTGSPDAGQMLADELKTRLALEQVPVYYMPLAIVTHGGPGILGVSFFTNPNHL